MNNPEILLRFVWTLAIIGGGILLYELVNRYLLTRARVQVKNLIPTHRRPTLLYFTTPACAPCKTVQRPAIEKLKASLGDSLEVVEIDAAAEPEIASQWGVLSVPTTFIIDTKGQPRHINHGVATADKLLKQIQELERS